MTNITNHLYLIKVRTTLANMKANICSGPSLFRTFSSTAWDGSHKNFFKKLRVLLFKGGGTVNQMYICQTNLLVFILKVSFSLVKVKKQWTEHEWRHP